MQLPLVQQTDKKERSSNLELFRIVCMLAIVAHHYVVNSGLMWSADSPIVQNPRDIRSVYLLLFGMWGKTGINCFLLITGYFMCKSKITLRKFLKLLLEVYFYKIAIYLIFLIAGREEISIYRITQVVFPVWDVTDNFVSCFLLFFLTIPFWTLLIQNMSKRQHRLLLALTLGIYTVCGSIPNFHVWFNYVMWFGVLFLLASYFRLYPSSVTESRKFWGWLSLACVIAAIGSVIVWGVLLGKDCYFWVSDSNKILAVAVAVSLFNWFRLLPMGQSRFVNWMASSTFAVLLIHSNSTPSRTWLWRDLVDCTGSFQLPVAQLAAYSLSAVILVFISCILIDKVRVYALETPLMTKFFNEKNQ